MDWNKLLGFRSKKCNTLLVISIISIYVLISCKYSFTGASVSSNLKLVKISRFENIASIINPSLAQDLTEKLRNKFLSQTNLELTNQDADIEFTGTITDYRVEPITISGNEQATQSRLKITVKVIYKNNIEKDAGWESTFTQFSDFESSKSLSSVEGTLVEEINDKLIQDIFNKAFSSW